MRVWQRKFGVPLLAVLLIYLAAPYVTLFRLADSIRRGDAAVLEMLVDWDQVREGIKEDICDAAFDMQPEASASARAGDTLPPFGFSFVRGIAANAIDEAVTPSAIVTATSRFEIVSPAGVREATVAAAAEPRIVWAFFDGPRTFHVELVPPPEAGFGSEAVRLQLDLGASGWKVTRAWLPVTMLAQANPRT